MASIIDPQNGEYYTQGLQGSRVCDEAIQCANRVADRLGRCVDLEDDDGYWRVHPASADGTREAADDVSAEYP